jgi:hypothetical protein
MVKITTREFWAIRATRSGASMFGSASALLKQDGKVLIFPTERKAKAHVAKIEAKVTSPNISYHAEEIDESTVR